MSSVARPLPLSLTLNWKILGLTGAGAYSPGCEQMLLGRGEGFDEKHAEHSACKRL